MKTVTALRHVHFEDLGTLEPLLQARDYHIQYFDAPFDDLSTFDAEEPDLLVILGGPIGAFDETTYPFLATELEVVRKRLNTGKPILGICLGAQLMARALGAKVYALGVKEIGFSPLAFTTEGTESPLRALNGVPVLHWHGDQFDIPSGATWLASTKIGPNQAFAVGSNALGLQFHLEADATQIERWLVGHACELSLAGIDPRTLREQAQQHGSTLALAARNTIEAWLDGFQI